MAVSYSTIDHRKWMFDISARLLYKGGYECFEDFFVIKNETFFRVSHLSRDTAKKFHTYKNNAYLLMHTSKDLYLPAKVNLESMANYNVFESSKKRT